MRRITILMVTLVLVTLPLLALAGTYGADYYEMQRIGEQDAVIDREVNAVTGDLNQDRIAIGAALERLRSLQQRARRLQADASARVKNFAVKELPAFKGVSHYPHLFQGLKKVLSLQRKRLDELVAAATLEQQKGRTAAAGAWSGELRTAAAYRSAQQQWQAAMRNEPLH